MNIYNKVEKFIDNNLNPTFDALEKLADQCPKLILPINLTLLVGFPAWLIFCNFIRKSRSDDD